MTLSIAPLSSTKPRTALQRAGHRLPVDPSLSFALVQERSAQRRELESDINRKFDHKYGAQLTHFLPNLLQLRVWDQLAAVAGARPARDGELFLEQYLDSPIEQFVAQAFRTPVDRDQIIEIGNLAAYIPGLAYPLFAVLATVLNKAGYRWATCTATPQVESMLAKMKFPFRKICTADPARLGEDSGEWGDYYASRPSVIVGDVRSAVAQINANRELSTLMRQFAQPVVQMAADLR
jgi:hypothetical protein